MGRSEKVASKDAFHNRCDHLNQIITWRENARALLARFRKLKCAIR